ncbi:hypothetical protein [Metallosphaera javensis (ex Sakai et al. 2022)]|uniref:hypothetical protein n=1 Tax=Metallosphaera javensis (ex Sakai et al. 2022) TaxID=2775498 RepID=UPI00258A89C8|nr:MAG: hypothetical protein MjAS7_1626 [Metallosphaera javensis (ex Sakai et al. 2022)]
MGEGLNYFAPESFNEGCLYTEIKLILYMIGSYVTTQSTTVSNIVTNANYTHRSTFQLKEYNSGIVINLGREIDHFETRDALVIIGKDKHNNAVYIDIEYTDEEYDEE